MSFLIELKTDYISGKSLMLSDRKLELLIVDETWQEERLIIDGFPAQPHLSAWQRFNRHFCAHLPQDLVAAADLPPHNALFSQQLLGLTHRWWTEKEDNDTDIVDVHSQRPQSLSILRDPVPHQFPDPQQPARPRRQPHNVPLLRSDWTIREVVTEEYRFLGSVNYELDTHTPAVWIQV